LINAEHFEVTEYELRNKSSVTRYKFQTHFVSEDPTYSHFIGNWK